MSHNIHLLRLSNVSHEEAQSNAEIEIESWGDENNWRTIIGSICDDGTTIILKGEDNNDLITMYANRITDLIKQESLNQSQHIETGLQFIQIGISLLNNKSYYDMSKSLKSSDPGFVNMWKLKHVIKEIAAREPILIEDKFNIWKQEYRSWELDEFGVTDVSRGKKSKSDKKYLVIIDMHS